MKVISHFWYFWTAYILNIVFNIKNAGKNKEEAEKGTFFKGILNFEIQKKLNLRVEFNFIFLESFQSYSLYNLTLNQIFYLLIFNSDFIKFF